jgi:hypothetical protein
LLKSSTMQPHTLPLSPIPQASASLPAVASEIADDELIARTQFRKGNRPWLLVAALFTVGAIVGGMALFSGRAPKPVAAAAPGTDDALERERELRASRAQGVWVELKEPSQTPSEPIIPSESASTSPGPSPAVATDGPTPNPVAPSTKQGKRSPRHRHKAH